MTLPGIGVVCRLSSTELLKKEHQAQPRREEKHTSRDIFIHQELQKAASSLKGILKIP